MIIVFIIVVLILTHYMAFVLGEEAGDNKWVERMRVLQTRFDNFVDLQLKTRKLDVKSETKKVRKVAINKK